MATTTTETIAITLPDMLKLVQETDPEVRGNHGDEEIYGAAREAILAVLYKTKMEAQVSGEEMESARESSDSGDDSGDSGDEGVVPDPDPEPDPVVDPDNPVVDVDVDVL